MARVLVVDDDPGVRHVVRRRLEAAGHSVREAEDGVAACDSLAAERPDLIVLDLVMPRLNGLELLDRMRSHPEWDNIPSVVITGSITSESAVRDLGADSMVRKPFSADQLLTHVDLVLAHVARHGAAPPRPEAGRSRPCILVVEDDEDVRDMLLAMFQIEGYDTMAASNGREALQVMRERRPCAVLLDLMMPIMDGWQFRRRQLEEPQLARVPVVCMSAVASPADVEAQLGLGCLRKPLDVNAVLEEIQRRCCGSSG